ncbi:MAG: hypothetical protein DI498_03535 [Paracoccus denitrificans]|nr:MAG: hypothetical protein DI498_03535 [Paracoccus denitrificans]PZO85596.1 MAG: hypothetical protein DI633_03535 [Paracoccus denitrificans]
MKPSLDILIPHFEDPSGLEISLESILAQTWSGRLRVVIADDGSDEEIFDQAQTICDQFTSRSDHRLTLARRPVNRGRPYTRNELLDLSEAPYIAWLDAGDTWAETKLDDQFSYMSTLYHGGRDLTATWITCDYLWRESSAPARRVNQELAGDQFLNLMVGGKLRAYLWTLVGPRESFTRVGYFDERLPRLQDMDYFVRFIRGGGKILKPRADRPLATYYKSDIGRNARDVYEAYNLIIDKNRPNLLRYRNSFTNDLRYKAAKLAARFAANNGDRRERIKYELIALRLKPAITTKQISRKIVNRLTT